MRNLFRVLDEGTPMERILVNVSIGVWVGGWVDVCVFIEMSLKFLPSKLTLS